MHHPSLSNLLAEFHSSIFHPAGPEVSHFSAHVSAAGTLTPDEGLNVYRQMHCIRMNDAMAMDFPATQTFLGHSKFERLVEDYWREYPSQSFSLDHLGRFFPIYISLRFSSGSFLAELALFEQTLVRIGLCDQPQAPYLDDNVLTNGSALLYTRFQMPGTTEIHAFKFDVLDAYQKLSQGITCAEPDMKKSIMLFSRADYQTRFRAICSDEYAVLARLFLGYSLEEIFQSIPPDTNNFLEKFGSWCGRWNADGVLILRPPS